MEKVKIGDKILKLEVLGDIIELSDKYRTFLLPFESFAKKSKYDIAQKCFILSGVELNDFICYDNDFENLIAKI